MTAVTDTMAWLMVGAAVLVWFGYLAVTFWGLRLRDQIRAAEVALCQRWTAQVEHLKGVLALAEQWEENAAVWEEHGPEAGAAVARTCAKELRDEWDRLALEDPSPREALCGSCVEDARCAVAAEKSGQVTSCVYYARGPGVSGKDGGAL